MDAHVTNSDLLKMQTQMRFFFDSALECNNQCVTNYDSKGLSDDERSCIENCFTKQKVWNDRLYNATK